jgi:hypothetical protein
MLTIRTDTRGISTQVSFFSGLTSATVVVHHKADILSLNLGISAYGLIYAQGFRAGFSSFSCLLLTGTFRGNGSVSY